MITLCYISCASHHPDDDELVDLLKKFHSNNSRSDITGLLLYNGKGTFLQVIEGDDSVIESLYKKIKNDKRHHRVTCIGKKTIEDRNFPNWKMGFRNTEKMDLSHVKGFSDFISKDNAIDYVSGSPQLFDDVLDHFKDKTRELVF